MLYNALGLKILNGSTTKFTFRGLPLIGACVDYGAAVTVDAAAALLAFGDAENVPVIITDEANDSIGATAALISALVDYSKFFVPGLVGPWLNSYGQTVPPCGPIFQLDLTGVDKLRKPTAIAVATSNFRSNHLFLTGCSAIWPDPDEKELLDTIQHPPIYASSIDTYNASVTPITYTMADEAMEYFDTLKAVWSYPQSNIFIEFAGLPTTIQQIISRGLERLTPYFNPATPTTPDHYIGIQRHFAAHLVPLLVLPPEPV